MRCPRRRNRIVNTLVGGRDPRDYYDATGMELRARVGDSSRGWTARMTGRWERHEPVRANTERFVFGTAKTFPPLAAVAPGRHAALEREVTYRQGASALDLGRSRVTSLRGELGVGDFRFGRIEGLFSFRSGLGPFALSAQVDAGYAAGGVPAQFLFRFGGEEGLGGYRPGEFGGTGAALATGRFLVPLPPFDRKPIPLLRRVVLPPLRPGVVFTGEAGWSTASGDAVDDLERINARITAGVRGSVGIGVSFFDDGLEIRWNRALERDRVGRWDVGLVSRR